MAGIHFKLLTSSSELAKIPFETGNLIFDQQARKIYLDGQENRIAYEQIMCLATDDMRTTMLRTLVSGFYFVLETNILWRLDDLTWIQITNPPEQEIIYGTIGSFPHPGDVTKLYRTDSALYHWDPTSNSYQKYTSGGDPQWIEDE